MSDFISRQKAIDALGEKPIGDTDWDLGCQNQWEWDTEILRTLPSAKPKRTAKVIEHDASITDDLGYKYWRSEYLCENCKKKVIGGDEYCSHCGSKLDWTRLINE